MRKRHAEQDAARERRAARAVTRGRFRVTQEQAGDRPPAPPEEPRTGDDRRALRGLQHQNTMVLARLAELEKAVRSQHAGGERPPAPALTGAPKSVDDLDASAATRPLRRAHDLATELRDALASARARAQEHEGMLKLLKQKHASLAAKLEAGQGEQSRLRRENEALRKDRDRFRRDLDDERARHRPAAGAAPPAAPPAPAPAVVARRAAADLEFAAIAAQAAPPLAAPTLAAPGAPAPPAHAPPAAPPPHRAVGTVDASLAVALTLKRSANAHETPAGSEDAGNNGGYFDTVHPEFAVALVVHWLLWGYAPRNVALAYDFGGVALLAAEGLMPG